ncbi:MAG TPA: carboxypeptidase regulatory-like domain-containing protein [Anaerolineales bacterium]|nr:carboxypeptidase regulatory-like domain-containing protein [Anaerolineales bacterium]HRK88950.1 carboxypeptidase regulatory-like domain-containing protein [Anaerolineales bacterium]
MKGNTAFRKISQNPAGKLVNVLLLVSLVLTSCVAPKKQGMIMDSLSLGASLKRWGHYEPPSFEQPNPVEGERPPNGVTHVQDPIENPINNLPIQFVENVGQFDQRTLYRTRVGNQSAIITKNELWLTVLDEQWIPLDVKHASTLVREDFGWSGVNLRLTFVDTREDVQISGFSPLDTQISYFGFEGTSKNVPVWEGVKYKEIYQGYDLVISGSDGIFSWLFFISDELQASDTQEIRLRVEGAEAISLDEKGIVVKTPVQDIRLPYPTFPNGSNVEKVYVDGIDIVFPTNTSARLPLKPLASIYNSSTQIQSNFDGEILNPSGYITILSGSVQDLVTDLSTDDLGQTYLVGYTPSEDFPTTPGAFNTNHDGYFDTFVSKLDSQGGLVYSTFIGYSFGTSIAVDEDGRVYITGTAGGFNFPITPDAFDTSYNGFLGTFPFWDAFLSIISSDGSELIYSTYIGGNLDDSGNGIKVDNSGNIYIAGTTGSSGTIYGEGIFPVTQGSYDSTFNGGRDAFITKFNSSGQMIFSTFLGAPVNSNGTDSAYDLAVDYDGKVYVVGETNANNFPTINAFDSIFNGPSGGWSDAFLAIIDSSGSQLLYSTYLGGNGIGYHELADGIDLDNSGNIYIVGETNSADFPITEDAIDSVVSSSEVFISIFDPTGADLIFSSFLGGSSTERSGGIAVGQNGDIYVSGGTNSVDFPVTTGAYDTTKNGLEDAFLTRVSIDKSLIYSTYFGASNESLSEYSIGVDVDTDGAAYIAGNIGYVPDVFVAKFDLYGNTVHEASVLTGCNVASECPQASSGNTQGVLFGPINTRTGGLYYQTEDINISTIARELSFFRSYSSLATDLYSSTLGYGWAHNLDTRLILPTDPDGEEGNILFKAHTANQYRFIDVGNGKYAPDAGIVGKLIYDNGEYTLTYPDQSVYVFDENGKIQSWSDAQGHLWQYTYDELGQLEQVGADSGARYLDLSYDPQGRIIEVMDHTGRNVTFDYDENGDLISMTDVMGEVWTYEYDDNHHLTQVLDPLGNALERTEYDEQGRAIKQWDGEGNLLGMLVYNADGTTTIIDPFGDIQTHSYDSRLTLVSNEDGSGGVTQKSYDYNFRPTNITDAGDATTSLVWSEDGANLLGIVDAEGGQTDIAYDSLNNPISVIDPLGYLTAYEYDGTLLTSTTNALNQETTYSYTLEGFIESVTDPLGYTTSYAYDSYGQRTSMIDSLGNTWTYSYDSLGRLIDTTDPLGRVNHSEYDAAGRLIRSVRNYDPSKSQNEDNLWNIVTEYEYDARGNQISVTDTLGRESRYEYDAAGRLVKSIDPAGGETANTYNEAGQLITTIDALGNVTNYTYDAAGRLVVTTDALGNTTSTIYNLDGTVASTSDPLGRQTSYTYDDLKRVLTVTLPNGAINTNTYDDNGNLIATTDALGNTTQYEYDALGRVIKTIDPLGRFTENFYDDAGRLVQSIDARGNATTYAYDSSGRQLSVTDALGNVTSYEYDNLGRRTAVIDAAGNRTEFTYDELDRIVVVTDPLGNTVTTEYDALGQVIRRTDANGNDAFFTYNNLGQTVSQTDALGNTTSFAYDALGNRVSTTNARGAVTSITYDALNRPVVTTNPLGYTSTTTYDIAGQVSASTNANNETTSFGYNSLGQQTTVTDPLGHLTQYNYDSLGRLTLITDANGISTAYEYDAMGRLSAVTENYKPGFQPDAQINVRTEYTYDENGNRLTIKDSNGNITTFTYDALNRLSTETDPLGNTWSYVYDELGRRTSMTDANGETTLYEYDNANRLTGIEYADDNDVSFAYDAGGRRTSMTDGMGTTTWEYDDLNRPIAITDPFDTTVSYAYDPVGNLERMLYPDKDVQYTYDDASRLIQVNDWTKNTFYEYDPLGRISAILRPNGVNSTYSYNAAGLLTLLTHETAEDELAAYQYAYDNYGNRIQAVERVKTTGSGPTVHLTVADNTGALMAGKEVYVFNGDTYTGYSAITDDNGQVAITLPQGSYRFRIDVEGTQYWSNSENHCTVGKCDNLLVTITAPTLVYVTDTSGTPQSNVPVYAFMDNQYTGYHGITDDEGVLFLRLPEGSYDLRADFIGNQFWSEYTCDVPYCWGVSIVVNQPLTVTVLDNIGMPHEGIEVYAFDGTNYTGKHGTTDENGQVQLTLLDGDYRFRADFDPTGGTGGTHFWSGVENHCTVPDCTGAEITVMLPLLVTVLDSEGTPQEGISVYAFDGSAYTGFNGTTDVNGRVTFTLPQGNYRFRADLNGTQFWSDTQNHCTVPDCSGAQITVTNSITVTVVDTENNPKAGVNVYTFNGATYTGYHGTTNSNGQVNLILPQGSYRFRADFNGTQFWSGGSNHCDVPGCGTASVTVTNGILVTVTDTDGAPKDGIKVYAFNGTTYTGYNATTDANGHVTLTLPVGSYRFRADINGTQFWSGTSNHCDVPGCGSAGVTVTNPVTVTVTDTDGAPKPGLKVYAFDGTTYTGYNATTNSSGQVTMPLPLGNYRFRADLNGTQFWSGTSNHCTIPGCPSAAVMVSIPLTITVQTADGTPQTGIKVYAFNGTTYTGYNATTNASGQVTMTLPLGNYRFRADYNNAQYWSGGSNHCTVPGCLTWTVIVGSQPIATATFTATATATATETPLPPTITPEATETASPTPEATPTETPSGSGYLPGLVMVSNPAHGHLLSIQPKPLLDPPNDVTVTVKDTDQTPKEGLDVYVFDGTTYTGYHGVTDSNGQAIFTLPDGEYRFRADLNGTQFWSWEANHCDVPGCEMVEITVTIPLMVGVWDSENEGIAGISVYAFDGDQYTGYQQLTDEGGVATFTLPDGGDYHFRADYTAPGAGNSAQLWSVPNEGCYSLHACAVAYVEVPKPVTVTVTDTDAAPKEALSVYVFDDVSYTGYHLITDASGQVTFTLPLGSYRFRADLNGTQFWNGTENHCDLNNACDPVSITVTKPLIVTIADELNTPYADLQVYAFDGDSYTGYHSKTDADGQVTFTLPEGSYRFRADLRGTQYWSATENACALPGCESASVTIPGGFEYSEVTIDYTYDSLYRLTNADYSTGDAYQYAYDAVGNRLTHESTISGLSSVIGYQYDAANRLASVDGVNYTFDANGNLLDDGMNTYEYDSANRLVWWERGSGEMGGFGYNGLGDRLWQDTYQNGSRSSYSEYTLDLNTGLTQVLSDGTTTYTYGLGRISQQSGTTPEYFLGDALGSVRQMTDQAGAITYARNYDPYGVVTYTGGTSQTEFGFTGEQYGDSTQLLFLRARYYNPADGRFQSRDTWSGDVKRPLSLNRWVYVEGNPINLSDPTGYQPNISEDLGVNDRDLTTWLYRELRNNAWSVYTLQIHEMVTSLNPLEIYNGLIAFKLLVQDRAKWDFKHKIQQELQANSFVLFHGHPKSLDYQWYERSVAGNIHFGYIGRAAGINRAALHGGAGYAEIVDPAHVQANESCCVCIPNGKGGCIFTSCGYFNLNWASTLFDDPTDYNAVEAGIVMYDTYGRFLTFDQYQSILSSYRIGFATTSEHLPWEWDNPAGRWPYEVGHFNGPFENKFEPEIQEILFKGEK